MTSSNGRPKQLLSRMDLDHISLPAGRRPRLVCAVCQTWQEWRRGMVVGHATRADAEVKCPGSHQRVEIDITPEQLRERRAAAVAHADAIARSPREGFQQAPPVPPAVHQIAVRRRSALAGAGG